MNWFREKININQDMEKFVIISSVNKKDLHTDIIKLICPIRYRITVPGTKIWTINEQYSFYLNITDENGNLLNETTRFIITKIKPYEDVIQMFRGVYRDFKDVNFIFKYGLQLNGDYEYPEMNQHLDIAIIKPYVNIPKENIKFNIDVDLWIKKE